MYLEDFPAANQVQHPIVDLHRHLCVVILRYTAVFALSRRWWRACQFTLASGAGAVIKLVTVDS